MSFYLVRVGEGSKYMDEALRESFVAIGWNEVNDLNNFKDSQQIKKALEKCSYDYTPTQIAINAGQLFRFGIEITNGDMIVSPLGKGEYAVGKVRDYYFETSPKGSCEYAHRRKIEWLDRRILKEDMSASLGYSVGGLLTVFSIDKHADEINALLSGEKFTPADKPLRVKDAIMAMLYEMNGREFEEFIRHLLEVIGFDAQATQYVSDKGIDVNGVLDAEGLADITLRLQLKRVKGSVGNKDVLALRGALSQGEHGCLITTSSFTAQAVEEAEAKGKVPIKLVDRNDLGYLILRHFDDLDETYKARFQIRKKKSFDIENQFEIIHGEEDEVEDDEAVSTKNQKRKKRKERRLESDTLICAAQEDGFKRAFIDSKAWWAVRIKEAMIPKIKYLAMYQVAPISEITHYGEVDRIELYQDTDKYKLYLKGDPQKFKRPIPIGKNRFLKPQGPKYAKMEKIMNAKTLDDIWS